MKIPKKPFLKVLKIILIVWLVCLAVKSFLPSVYYKVAFFLTYPLHVSVVEFIDENTQGENVYIWDQWIWGIDAHINKKDGASENISPNLSTWILIKGLPKYHFIMLNSEYISNGGANKRQQRYVMFDGVDYIRLYLFNQTCGIICTPEETDVSIDNVTKLENIWGNWYYYEEIYDTSKLPG